MSGQTGCGRLNQVWSTFEVAAVTALVAVASIGLMTAWFPKGLLWSFMGDAKSSPAAFLRGFVLASIILGACMPRAPKPSEMVLGGLAIAFALALTLSLLGGSSGRILLGRLPLAGMVLPAIGTWLVATSLGTERRSLCLYVTASVLAGYMATNLISFPLVVANSYSGVISMISSQGLPGLGVLGPYIGFAVPIACLVTMFKRHVPIPYMPATAFSLTWAASTLLPMVLAYRTFPTSFYFWQGRLTALVIGVLVTIAIGRYMAPRLENPTADFPTVRRVRGVVGAAIVGLSPVLGAMIMFIVLALAVGNMRN